MSEFQDSALICLNGHVVNDSYFQNPSGNKKFCSDCGSETIYQCPSCNSNIIGRYHVSGFFNYDEINAPYFCHNCGDSYPWLKEKLKAVRELADEIDELSEEEREKLKSSIDDLVSEGPRTELAATRFKKIIPKVGTEFANGIRSIMVDIASETGKKLLGLKSILTGAFLFVHKSGCAVNITENHPVAG